MVTILCLTFTPLFQGSISKHLKRQSWTFKHWVIGGSGVRNPHASQEMRIWSLGREDPLEKEMEIHSSIFAWRIPWTKKPGGLQSMRLQRVRCDLVIKQQPMFWGFYFPAIFEILAVCHKNMTEFSRLCLLVLWPFSWKLILMWGKDMASEDLYGRRNQDKGLKTDKV